MEGTEPERPEVRIERPVFVVATPGSGAGALGAMLARSPAAASIADRAPVLARMPALALDQRGWDSERLTGTDLTPQLAQRVRAAFAAAAGEGDPPAEGEAVRLLDADPANCMRIPFLAAVFPQSIFVYAHREPAECLAAMLAAWESGDEVTHPELPGWPGPPWSLLLTPEWRTLAGRDLPEIVTEQWRMATRILLDDLERLPPARWCVVDAGALAADPGPEVERVCEFAGAARSRVDRPGAAPGAGERRGPDRGRARGRTGRAEELGARAREWIARSPAEATAVRPAPRRST